ncbi:MAG: trypsin-like peptidase domain-containing protein [Rhodospirillales bacterium]|nr:trypsin-like peptidase domain-containing protein [Rhodospirillales bacterium]
MNRQRVGIYILIWLLILATIYIGDQFVRDVFLTADAPRAVTARGSLAETEKTNITLFERSAPSVVYIFTRNGNKGGGAGSGFIWDSVGHVVTNHHVVKGAREVLVRMDDGEAVRATVIGAAPDYDLAVVRLQDLRAVLRPIPVGKSGNLKVGQAVFAIGNPFGLSRTLTTGIISALNRRLPTANHREVAGVIQTDAAINPGNSGGPLLDSAGRLIGVNTAIISGTGSSAGIGFAVPVDIVNSIVPQLIAKGRVPRLGIGVAVLAEEATARLGVNGLVISRVLRGSSAARAGIRAADFDGGSFGDVITHVNGVPVRSIAQFATELGKVGIGNKAELTLVNGGRTRRVLVEVSDIS